MIAGIDFAAAIDRTAIVELEWESDGILISGVRVGADDSAVGDAMDRAEAAGVDVPFGWPDGFVDAIVGHRQHEFVVPVDSGREWRRPLTYRLTDLDVVDRLGIYPLSVSADRIGHAALRWAAIAARSAESGRPIARDGASGVFEVYPAASLRTWQLGPTTYKGKSRDGARSALLDQIAGELVSLRWGGWRGVLVSNDDAFDAFVCALTARAAQRGDSMPPKDVDAARREGWIHLPLSGLNTLGPDTP